MTLVRLKRAQATRRTVEEGTNFAAVLAESRGEGVTLPPPPDWPGPPTDLAEAARRALFEVADPEFPISLVDLGLIYGIDADEERGALVVRVTLTATACPCIDFIKWDIRERLSEIPGVREVEVEVVWDPPWTTARITERGRAILEEAGIALVS